MPDIGFWELVIIAVMALVVVGPERLPLVLGKVGRWVGKARAYITTVRGDIEREVQKAEKIAAENEALLKLKEATELAKKQAQDAQQTLNNPAGTAVDKLMGREPGETAAATPPGQTESATEANPATPAPTEKTAN